MIDSVAANYDDFYFDEKAGLFYSDQPVADFNLSVIDKKIPIGPSGVRGRPLYLIEVSYMDGRAKRSEWTDTLKKMDLFELFEIDDSFLSAESRKMLLSKMMQEAGRIPERFVIDSCDGLQIVQGIAVYVLGEHVLSHGEIPDGYEIITHHAMKPILYKERKELPALCEGYIHLLPGVSENLFFGALFAVVKPFCSILDIPCGSLLSLVASPGHLKTTLARLYALWLDSKAGQETSFSSLMRNRDILKAIDDMSGQNFLIDDLHKMPNTNEEKRQEQRLDIVSRHVDARTVCANVILTGETLEKMGIFSCMDRIFQVRMPKMDAKQIEELKKRVSSLQPGLMPSVALAFARALMQEYEAVLNDIQTFYKENIIEQDASGYATRVHRHALFIRMTEYLFEKYFYNKERLLSKNRDLLNNAINEQIRLQQAELQKIRLSEEPHDYIAELYEIITAGEPYISVYGDCVKYSDSKNSCLIHKGKIYITTDSLKDAFFERNGKHVPPKLIIDALHKEGLLEEEPGSKGKQKNYIGRKRYVISMRYLLSYLSKNGFPVSEESYKKYVTGNR